TQTSKKLYACGISHGVIKAGFTPRPMERVQVASVQTLWARAMRTQTMTLPPAKLILVDEAHHVVARTYQKLIEAYPNAVVIGLRATPCRGDGRGLGSIFTLMIECPQVAELIEKGFLVRSRCYAPVTPNLRGVRVRAGDYVEEQLAARMDDAKLIGDIVTHWHKFGERLECSQCSTPRLAGKPCPHCGFLPQRPARAVFVGEGELGLVTNGRARTTPADPQTRQRWHGMLTHIARERGYKPGWIAHKYKENSV